METAPALPTVLLLGSPHLANPNRDLFNVQFDDMLGPRRQHEIVECVERLARFRPTKVALEVVTDREEALNDDYRTYRASTFALTADERHQFGFRIAVALGHERVHAIDWNEGTGDLGRVYAFARAHHPAIYEELFVGGQRALAAKQAPMEATSVLELLRRANDPAGLAANHRVYLTLARVGAGKAYVGVDWVKQWYERNLIIFVNLTRIITAPTDRVLVIYGSGHIPLLAQFIRDSCHYALEPNDAYLR